MSIIGTYFPSIIGGIMYQYIAPGQSLSVSQILSQNYPVNVPAGLATGTYALCAMADGATGVPETNDNNNVIYGHAISVVQDADYKIISGEVAPSNPVPGTEVILGWTVQNIGNSIPLPLPVTVLSTIFFSTDKVLDSTDLIVQDVNDNAPYLGKRPQGHTPSLCRQISVVVS